MELQEIVKNVENKASKAAAEFDRAAHGQARLTLEDIRDFLNEHMPANAEEVTEPEVQEEEETTEESSECVEDATRTKDEGSKQY